MSLILANFNLFEFLAAILEKGLLAAGGIKQLINFGTVIISYKNVVYYIGDVTVFI